MAITSDDIKAQILLETGDVDATTGDAPASAASGLVAQNIDTIWDLYVAKDQIAPGLRALYVKRAALQMILQTLAQKRFDVSDVLAGLTLKAGQIWGHYTDLLAIVENEIGGVEHRLRASGGYTGSRLTTRAPVTPRCPPDGNWRRYGGDLYANRRRGGR